MLELFLGAFLLSAIAMALRDCRGRDCAADRPQYVDLSGLDLSSGERYQDIFLSRECSVYEPTPYIEPEYLEADYLEAEYLSAEYFEHETLDKNQREKPDYFAVTLSKSVIKEESEEEFLQLPLELLSENAFDPS